MTTTQDLRIRASRLEDHAALDEVRIAAFAPVFASFRAILGMRVATVSTGGDPSHQPARRAYAKAGLDAVIPSVWMCKLL